LEEEKRFPAETHSTQRCGEEREKRLTAETQRTQRFAERRNLTQRSGVSGDRREGKTQRFSAALCDKNRDFFV
jgi:hypothetical protein